MTLVVFLTSLLGAMALGMPIAFALLVCSVALMAQIGLFDPVVIAQNVFNGADNFPLMAVPFFLLAGELMNAGGLSKRIVDFAIASIGHFHGGLGYVAIAAAVVMAAISGSAVADTAALGALLLPMMKRAGYDPNRSGGLLAAGGIIAPVIPPSIGLIIFGVAASVSITKLFIAGIVPGLLMALSLVVTWWWLVKSENLTPVPKATWSARVRAARDGGWALIMPVIIIGGLKFGIFTPTEAAVVAAVYALLVGGFVYRELKPAALYGIFLSTAKMTAVIMFLVATAMVSAWLITIANIPAQIGALLGPLIGSPTLLLLMMMVLVVLVGTALDFVPTVLILTPVLMPLVKQAGIDPVYFGVLFIINNAIGLITPPVGIVLNVICGVGKLRMEELIVAVWPFLISQLAVLFLLVLFPQLVLAPLRWLY